MTEQQQWEFNNLREEMNTLRTYPIPMAGIQRLDNQESIDFRTYKKNLMDFLERVDEALARSRENRWTIIKGMLDEYFKNVHDNWWTATRHEVPNYAAFKACLLYTSRCV